MSKQNIEAKIVADSVNPHGKRITSFLLTYPRFIHSEIMTHRQLSRNAASSRAIPIKKIISAVEDNPAMPEWWGANQSGMQAKSQLDLAGRVDCKDVWCDAADSVIGYAKKLQRLGLHKQIANRLLEPWFHITVLVTATEWDNFFALRAHPDAQPEFQVLAYRMLNEYLNNKPEELHWGDWHLPFADVNSKPFDSYSSSIERNIIQSVACAARTSYTTHDGDFPFDKQRGLVEGLRSSGHWSPFEHQARASRGAIVSGNFRDGWAQYRQMFKGHTREVPSLQSILDNKPDWVTL